MQGTVVGICPDYIMIRFYDLTCQMKPMVILDLNKIPDVKVSVGDIVSWNSQKDFNKIENFKVVTRKKRR